MDGNTSTTSNMQVNNKLPLFIAIGCGVLVLCLICVGIFYAASTYFANRALEKITEETINDALERQIEQETGSDIEIGDNAKLPAGWPTDFPIFEGSKIILSSSSKNGNGDTFTATLQITGKSDTEVLETYRNNLKSQGWKIDAEYDFGVKTLTASKDARVATVTIVTDTDKNEIVVSQTMSYK